MKELQIGTELKINLDKSLRTTPRQGKIVDIKPCVCKHCDHVGIHIDWGNYTPVSYTEKDIARMIEKKVWLFV